MHLITLVLILINVAFADAGHIRFLKGEVYIADQAASKGQNFNAEDIISTRKNSLAIVTLNDGSNIKLSENTSITVNQLAQDHLPSEVSLNLGAVVINVLKSTLKKNLTKKFILKTKTVSMGVRGTTFFASFGKNNSKDIWMCVNEGEVGVKSVVEKEERVVKVGEGVRVENGEKTSKPKPLVWTKKLNWNFESENIDELKNNVSIEEAYMNPLEFYYE